MSADYILALPTVSGSSPIPTRVKEVRTLSRLALPLVAGHVGNQMMGIVDTMMVGRLSKAALGGFRIPQRGLLAAGDISFDALDPERHSTRIVRAFV